jgi:senataxin
VKRIPDTFSSVTDYMQSFIPPLIEETHSDLLSNVKGVSRAPTCIIYSVERSKEFKPPKDLFYEITLKTTAETGKDVEKYEPEVGDLIALTDVRPKCIDDLNRPKRSYLIAYVHGAKNETSDKIPILASKPIFTEQDMYKYKKETPFGNKKETLFAVYLVNMTTNVRIWKALNPEPEGGNTNIIKTVLRPNSAVRILTHFVLQCDTHHD